jgi:hypothetical protein
MNWSEEPEILIGRFSLHYYIQRVLGRIFGELIAKPAAMAGFKSVAYFLIFESEG